MQAGWARQQPDRGLLWFVGASVALHISGALLSEMLSRPTFQPRQTIEIALAPAGNAEPAPAGPAQAAPPAAAPRPTPPPPKPVAEKPKPKPVPPKPQAQPKPKPAPEPAAVPTPPPDVPAASDSNLPPAATQTLSDVRKLLDAKKEAIGGTGDGVEGGGYSLPTNVKGRLYFSQLEAAIRSAWAVPPGARRTPVEIEVLIGSTGKLIQRRLRQSSGDNLLDRSALAAVDIADIPAPPAEFRTPLRLILRLIPPEN